MLHDDSTPAAAGIGSIAACVAASTAFLACAWVLLVPSSAGGPFFAYDFLHGSYWQRRFFIPVGFWILTAGYALGMVRFVRAPRSLMPRAVRLLLGVHMYLALARFIAFAEFKGLTSQMFVLYGLAIASLALLALCVWYFSLLRPPWAALTDPFVLPIVLTPLAAAVGFRLDQPILFAIPAIAAVVVAVRGHFDAATRAVGSLAARMASREGSILLLLLLIALAARLTAAYRLGSMDLELVLTNSDDAQGYYRSGRQILMGEPVILNMSAGYNTVVFVYYWLTGGAILPMLLLQAALCGTLPLAVYLYGRRAFGEVPAVVAAGLAAMSELLIFNSVNLTREAAGSVLLGWFCVLLLPLVTGVPRRRVGRLILVGLVAGGLITIELVFVPVFVLFLVLFVVGEGGVTLRGKIAGGILTIAAALTVIVCVRWLVTGEPGLSLRTAANAITLSGNYNPYAEQLYAKRINPFAFPREFLTNFMQAPRENAMLFLGKIQRDFRLYFFESQSGAFDPILLVRNSSLAAMLNTYGYAAAFLGFFLGLRKIAARDTRWAASFAYLTTATFASVYIVLFFGYTRFRATIQPLLLLFLAFGIVEVGRWLYRDAVSQ